MPLTDRPDTPRGSRLLEGGALALVLALALGLRIAALLGQKLIDDELFHLEMARRSAGFLLEHATISASLPAWSLLFKLWLLAVPAGAGDVALKALPVLLGLLGVAAAFLLGREAAGRHAGLLAALLVAVAGYPVHFSTLVTPYAFVALLGTLSSWAGLAVLRRGSRGAALVYAATTALVFYTHQSGALLLGVHLAGALLVALGGERRHLRLFLAAQGGALLLASGAIVLLALEWGAMKRVGLPYVPEAGPRVVLTLAGDLVAYHALPWARPAVLASAVALLLAGLVAAVRAVRAVSSSSTEDAPGAFLAAATLLPLPVCVLGSAVVSRELLYAERFFAPFVSAGAALAAVSILGLVSRARPGPVRLATAAAFLLSLVAAQAGSLGFLLGRDRDAETFPIDEISAALARQARPGDLAVVHHDWYRSFFERYYRRDVPPVVGAVQDGLLPKPFGGMMDPTTPADVDRLLARLRGHRRLLLFLTPTTNRQWRDPAGLVEKALDARYPLLEGRCFACRTGDPVLLRVYDLRRAR
jgi:hypothetical protein